MLKFLKKSYVYIILFLFYVPIIFGLVFSFNKQGSEKTDMNFTSWNSFSLEGYKSLIGPDHKYALINSLLIGLITATIVIFISLLTIYALWKQKNKAFKSVVNATSNVPLINPDIITAISLAIVYSTIFGALSVSTEGMYRAIISHVTMIMPYAILLMYPRSEKFSKSLFEASNDLGYNSWKTWFKTYFIFMLPITMASFLIALTLSFDDFILTRVTSNASTIGVQLYEGTFKSWGLALGAIMLCITLVIAIILGFAKTRREYA